MLSLTVKETLEILKETLASRIAGEVAPIQVAINDGTKVLQRLPLDQKQGALDQLGQLVAQATDLDKLRLLGEESLGQFGQVCAQLEILEQPLVPTPEEDIPGAHLFIDLETATVIDGKQAGVLRSGRAMTIVRHLAGAKSPVPVRELAQSLYPKSSVDRSLNATRPVIGKLNHGAKDQGLPRVVTFSEQGGYVLTGEYEAIGVARLFDPDLEEKEVLPTEIQTDERVVSTRRPTTYPIHAVVTRLQEAGFDGSTIVRVRHLASGLVASGHLRVGEHVLEKNAGGQMRLEYTDAGLDVLKDIFQNFGTQGKIFPTTVGNWLDQQAGKGKPKSTSEPIPRRYWISQLVETTGVEADQIDGMVLMGTLQEGTHYFKDRSGRRVFEPSAVQTILEKKGESQASVKRSDRVVNLASRSPIKLVEDLWENPYGKNGPAAVNEDYSEYLLAQALLKAMPTIAGVTGKPVQETFTLELAHRVGELEVKLGVGPHGEGIPEEALPVFSDEQARDIRRGVAATIAHIVHTPTAKELRFVEPKRPGVKLTHTAIKQLVEGGHEGLAMRLARTVAGDHPTRYEVDPNGIVNPRTDY